MSEQHDSNLPQYALVAQYDDVTSLVKACKKVRDAGYTKWDSYSPFPVHGIDPAMGIKPTKLPLLIFFMGIMGACAGVYMQWWMNAEDYQFMVSGKPMWSLPANIPVAFETTVLFAGLTAIFGTLLRNGLPRFHHPLFNLTRFAMATDDKFFISVEAQDGRFESSTTRQLLESTGAVAVESVVDDRKVDHKLPKPLAWLIVLSFFGGLVPLGFIATRWQSTSDMPRIHPNPNMDFQQKFKAQSASPHFQDGRAMRPSLEDTVAQGALRQDDAYERGLDADGNWLVGFPEQIAMDETTMNRGEQRYNIYCQPCHGMAGYGDGPVARRMVLLQEPKWAAPTSLNQDFLRTMPEGKLFHTITHGVRNMNGYGHMVPADDRWAIIMYIRALQDSQLSSGSN